MSIVAGFWVVSFLLIMTPGADWAYAISAGINGRRVVPAVMGLMSGHLLATLIVVAGVGVVIAQHPLALTGLTVAGAVYLLWLGIGLLRHPAAPEKAAHHAGNWRQWAVKGLCISGLNPKVFTFPSAASAVYRPDRKLVDSGANVRAWRDAPYHLYAGLSAGGVWFESGTGDPATGGASDKHGIGRDNGADRVDIAI